MRSHGHRQSQPNGRLVTIMDRWARSSVASRRCDPEKELEYKLPPELDRSNSNLEIQSQIDRERMYSKHSFWPLEAAEAQCPTAKTRCGRLGWGQVQRLMAWHMHLCSCIRCDMNHSGFTRKLMETNKSLGMWNHQNHLKQSWDNGTSVSMQGLYRLYCLLLSSAVAHWNPRISGAGL